MNNQKHKTAIMIALLGVFIVGALPAATGESQKEKTETTTITKQIECPKYGADLTLTSGGCSSSEQCEGKTVTVITCEAGSPEDSCTPSKVKVPKSNNCRMILPGSCECRLI